MEIHLNITFPRLPCELATLDVMDVSGEVQTGVAHGVNKVRLSSVAQGSLVLDTQKLVLQSAEANSHLADDYCGSCYSAPAPENAIKKGCCNTCEEVREAYASNSWAFGRGEGVEQCEREHYAERLDAQQQEGCRIEGVIRVNKVVGQFHIAPGRSYTNGNMHVHDLDYFFSKENEGKHTMTHNIHALHFGPQVTGSEYSQWTDHHHSNPLDGHSEKTDEAAHNYMYFVKVVSTSYLPLGWTDDMSTKSHSSVSDMVPIGFHGKGWGGAASSVETHQYSVTSHHRSLGGGTAADEGHRERVHAYGGIPGVFVSYDISPMKVINREQRTKSFANFLTGVCAVVGGTLTVAAAIDRGVYEGSNRLKKLHQG